MTPNHMIRFKNNLTKGRIYKEKRNLPLFVFELGPNIAATPFPINSQANGVIT